MLRRASRLSMLVLLFACPPAYSQTPQDASEVRALAKQYESAWNAHDAKAFARLLTDDAEWVNVTGARLKGRQQIEQERARAHQMQFSDSVWSTQGVEVEFLKPDVALVYVDWSIRGDRDPNGTPRQPRSGVLTWVVVKQHDGWKIRSGHNSNKLGA